MYYIGSYRKDDVDCSENVILKKKRKQLVYDLKKTLYVHHHFCAFVS